MGMFGVYPQHCNILHVHTGMQANNNKEIVENFIYHKNIDSYSHLVDTGKRPHRQL